ncbi:alpha/beta hydrolase [Synechocystis sp. LKSZ1]|uniref:alpha/beta fold hydrolase n=1 Tax=Synechocystis sp. LKSZ1 TaxID=3144951 RepID=UPI00336BFBAE
MVLDILRQYNLQITGNLQAPQTILFAHGFGSDQRAWRFITPAFQEQYRLVLFDLAGCGGVKVSERETLRHTSLQDYAEDLIQICDYLQLRQAHLIAHSVSSMLGTLVALKRPEFFTSLVFIGASPCYLNAGDYQGGFQTSDISSLLNEMAHNYANWARKYAPSIMNAPTQPLLSEEFSRSLLKLRPDFALLIFSLIMDSDYRQAVSQIRLPVLILQTKEDLFVPQSVGEYLHQRIWGSTLRLIPAKGHFPHMSNPQAVIEAISDFYRLIAMAHR